MPLLLLFIIIPVIEIALFIQIGDKIGLGWTIFTIIATAFIGTSVVRKQGLNAWNKAQSHIQQNQIPMEEVFTGLCLLVAGALLLTPGFLTDAIGFTLLFPPFRRGLGKVIWGWIQKNGSMRMQGHMGGSFQNKSGFHPNHNSQGFENKDIIDGDFTIIDPESEDNKPQSPNPDKITHQKDKS